MNKINQWLENSSKGIINKEVFICRITQDILRKKLHNAMNTFTSKIKFVTFDENEATKKYKKYKNIIIDITPYNGSDYDLNNRLLADGIILIDDQSSIQALLSLIEQQNSNSVHKQEIKYTHIEKFDAQDIFIRTQEELLDFVIQREKELSQLGFLPPYLFSQASNLNLYFNIFKQKNILFANLAHHLYRLGTLDFRSSITAIGRKIHKQLGVKSKVLSPLALQIPVPLHLAKNSRVYDLNENELEIQVKKNIATKLIQLDLKELDITTIADLTQLQTKVVESIYKKYKII